VLEEGRRVESEEGALQGAVISPLLANIYLHYVYDLGGPSVAASRDCVRHDGMRPAT
jgi:hypothetical protein